jgi:hypothetical protein
MPSFVEGRRLAFKVRTDLRVRHEGYRLQCLGENHRCTVESRRDG